MGKFSAVIDNEIDGLNYDIDSQAIVAQLEEWDAKFGVEIVEIRPRSAVTVRFERLPDDVNAFAEEVAEFCPDIIFQGFDYPEALAEDLRETRTLFLWWD